MHMHHRFRTNPCLLPMRLTAAKTFHLSSICLPTILCLWLLMAGKKKKRNHTLNTGPSSEEKTGEKCIHRAHGMRKMKSNSLSERISPLLSHSVALDPSSGFQQSTLFLKGLRNQCVFTLVYLAKTKKVQDTSSLLYQEGKSKRFSKSDHLN